MPRCTMHKQTMSFAKKTQIELNIWISIRYGQLNYSTSFSRKSLSKIFDKICTVYFHPVWIANAKLPCRIIEITNKKFRKIALYNGEARRSKEKGNGWKNTRFIIIIWETNLGFSIWACTKMQDKRIDGWLFCRVYVWHTTLQKRLWIQTQAVYSIFII